VHRQREVLSNSGPKTAIYYARESWAFEVGPCRTAVRTGKQHRGLLISGLEVPAKASLDNSGIETATLCPVSHYTRLHEIELIPRGQ
jgi:hypothetical protein